MSSKSCCCSCCAGCCSFPNGMITLIPAVLSTIIAILSTVSWTTCQYAQVKEESSDTWYNVGLFLHEVNDFGDWLTGTLYGTTYNVCVAYSDLELDLQDSAFKGAKTLARIASSFGWIMMLVIWSLSPCVKLPRWGWKVVGSLFFLIGLFQMLTLMMLGSNVCKSCGWSADMTEAGLECVSTCRLSIGGIVAIIMALLSWFTGAFCFIIPGPAEEEGAPQLSQVHDERVESSKKTKMDKDMVKHRQEAMENKT